MKLTESLQDPRDPWAWRNPWSSDHRTDYPELWIIVSLVTCLLLITFIVVVPVVIHRYCKNCCPWPKIWTCVDRIFASCGDLDDRSQESYCDIESPSTACYRNQHTLKPPPINYYLHQNRRSPRTGTNNQLCQSHSAPDHISNENSVLKQWNESMSSINSVRSVKSHFVVPKIRLDKV